MAQNLRKAKPGSEALSLAEARRIALHAQGFATREENPSRAQMLRTIKRIGLLQLDSVNVLVRSHYLPPFARHGAYPVETLDAMSQKTSRALFEYWGHEASLIPVEYQPLFRWRMDEARAGSGSWASASRLARERPDFIAAVLAEIAERGPLGAGELSNGGKSTGNWWGWSDGKRALEYLFWTGQLTSAGRRGFERLYALPERVIPARILAAPTPAPAAAQRELVKIAAAAHGVATEIDLRDYFRLSVADARARIRELVDEGVLRPVAVEGWKQQAYLHREAVAPRVDARALIAPFDSLIWMRQRTERLFDFHYRLAFYTPKHKRAHGYYVMPFLLGDRLVARVDLKSDREQGRLLVLGGHAEPHVAPQSIAPQLKAELTRLAAWLGLKRLAPRGRGELVRALRRA
jgi:uncharacterized protein YcaQ